MKFEVINHQNKIVMNTEYEEEIPSKKQCEHMLKAGYKFRLDGKPISRNKIKPFIEDSKTKGNIN